MQSQEVRLRLSQEEVQTAADLLELDKVDWVKMSDAPLCALRFHYVNQSCQEDLKDLGLNMVERRRVLRWAFSPSPTFGLQISLLRMLELSAHCHLCRIQVCTPSTPWLPYDLLARIDFLESLQNTNGVQSAEGWTRRALQPFKSHGHEHESRDLLVMTSVEDKSGTCQSFKIFCDPQLVRAISDGPGQ